MIRLTFLGTRAAIEEKNEKHFYHSSMLLQSFDNYPFRLLIDYGQIHAYDLSILKPDAILITHAHPDHYLWTLQEVNFSIPVYLTQETLNYSKYSPLYPRIFIPYQSLTIGPFHILPYRVIHSIRCPAVGFKIQLPDGKVIVYNSDLIDLISKEEILPGVDYYIGDGSAVNRNLVRRKGELLFGHTTIPTQINWCKKFGINNIIFTHIGKEIIDKEDDFLEYYPKNILAYDQMKIMV